MTHYDLHTHSTASDGSLTPTALVDRASQMGVTHLALTDHDGTGGIAEARAQARALGIELIAGVEISVTWQGGTIHLVGLNIDIGNADLQRGLAGLRAYRKTRAERIAHKLEKAGIAGALEGAKRYASEQMLGRVHFARFLIEQGHAKDMKDVFARFLVKNRPGYVTGEWAPLEDAVGWITAAGGQAVIAHPARYKLTSTKLRRLLGDFKGCGGEGIEVVSGSHSRDECHAMLGHALRFGLLASCGSDYHGPVTPWVELGRLPALPQGCVPVWERWAAWNGAGAPQALAR